MMRVPIAGLLAWVLPGLGHIYLGFRTRGIIFAVTITVTFWAGAAIGGVRGTVNPRQRTGWFIAELCTGGNTLAACALRSGVSPRPQQKIDSTPYQNTRAEYLGPSLSIEIGIVYASVAGLLNLLVILDAMVRADVKPEKERLAFADRRGSSAGKT